MKLAVAVAGKEALPSAFVVWRGFEESLQKAADSGYHGVELALKTADDVDAPALRQALERCGLEIACISTGQVFADLGLYFTHPDPAKRNEVIEVFKGLVRLAAQFGQLVNVGRARGFIAEGQTPGEAERLFTETARHICDFAEPLGVSMIIEPVNRYEINFVNNLDQGGELVRKVGRPNLGLMPDVFHMNIEDDRIGESLKRNGELVRYIHLADSNRLAPGQGHLDFAEVFDALHHIAFDGWASIEILPEPDPDTAAREAAQYVLPLIEQYNSRKEAAS